MKEYLATGKTIINFVSPFMSFIHLYIFFPKILLAILVCCMLYVLCCMLYILCCMFYVVYFMLYVLCCIFYAVCFMLYVVCFMFYKFYCLWWIEHVHNQAFRTLVRLSEGFCKVALLFPIRWFPKKNVVETSIHIS